MKIRIIYADSKGGIKTVSNILHKAFIASCIDSELLNMNDYGETLWQKLKNSYKIIKNYSKKDILILQHYDPIFFGIFLKFMGYKNIINCVHIDLYDYYKSVGILKKIIIRFMFFSIRKDLIVFVSNEAELKAKKKFNLANTKTIYNIYSPPLENLKFKSSDKPIVLGTVSRLHKIKNVDLAILVVAKLRELGKDVILKIYGDGDNSEHIELEKLIKKINAENFIFMQGAESDKNKIYNSIDALISFSSIEGLPTVILESINFNKPIFYTDCSSGPRELMSPNSNPLEKTNSLEKTNVGYLVKSLFKDHNYSEKLSDYDKDYVDFLNRFINDLENNYFDMQYDWCRFSKEKLIVQWINLIKEIENNEN